MKHEKTIELKGSWCVEILNKTNSATGEFFFHDNSIINGEIYLPEQQPLKFRGRWHFSGNILVFSEIHYENGILIKESRDWIMIDTGSSFITVDLDNFFCLFLEKMVVEFAGSMGQESDIICGINNA